jgi:hypothetical protein
MMMSQDLMNELFGAGASIRDTNLVQCENEVVAGAVSDILKKNGLACAEVEYEARKLSPLARQLVADYMDFATNRRRGAGRGTSEVNSYE